MKHIPILIIFVVLVHGAMAQTDAYSDCTYSYFKPSNKISTSICYDKDNRWGKAIAYNINGKIIYEKQLRKVAGHSSVTFSYHPNGAVAKAEWSSAPDAGIQWYKSIHEFSETGELINQTEWSHDQKPSNFLMPDKNHEINSYDNRMEEEEETENIEIVECIEPNVSELWFVNKTRYTLEIRSGHKLFHDEKYTALVAPGDTVKGGQQIQIGPFENPIAHFNIDIRKKKKRKAGTFIIVPAKDGEVPVRKDLKQYYFEIH